MTLFRRVNTESGSRHADIARFMEARAHGVETNQDMVWDPATSKFVLVPKGSAPDRLPNVTPEDLQAFTRRSK